MTSVSALSHGTEQQKRVKVVAPRTGERGPAATLSRSAAWLQHTAGNQALSQLGRSQGSNPALARAVLQRLVAGPVQTKMTLGPVGDQYEQEADRVAKEVVQQMHDTEAQNLQRAPEEEDELQAKRITQLVQRAPEEEDELQMKRVETALQRAPEDEDELQMKRVETALQRAPEEEDELQMKRVETALQRAPEEEDELQMKSLIQRSNLLDGGPVGDDIESAIRQSRGGGQSLPEGLRGSMEHAFGADFSSVRVHTDANANTLNRSLQARAFTTGQDIFVRQGDYNPGTNAGQELLAHELTHVVQQNGPAVQREES